MTRQTQKCKSTTSSAQAHAQRITTKKIPTFQHIHLTLDFGPLDINKSNNMNFEHNMTKSQTFLKKRFVITDFTSSKWENPNGSQYNP
jgi:hypothetical protein